MAKEPRSRFSSGEASSRDLVQESHVRIVENPYVRDVVAQHRNAGRTHAERPAGVAVAIESGGVQNGWMHHSRPEYLHPAGALAARAAGPVTQLALNVHLGRRLSEREIAWPEARFRLAEEPVGEMGQRRLEIDEAYPLVDRQAFDLREHRRVRCVEEIPAVGVPRTEDPDRRLEFLHR